MLNASIAPLQFSFSLLISCHLLPAIYLSKLFSLKNGRNVRGIWMVEKQC